MKKIELNRNTLKKLYVEEKNNIFQISKIFTVSSTTVYRRLIEYEIPIRSLSESYTKYPKQPFSNNSNEKTYLLGFRAGDLHARWRGYSVEASCASTHSAQIKLIKNLFEKYGHIYTNLRKDGKTTHILALLHPSFDFLISKPNEIEIDILNNDNQFFNFLSGYADAEGSWDTKRGRFRIATYDKRILEQIYNKLKDMIFKPAFSINNHIRKKQKQITYVTSVVNKPQLYELTKILLPLSKHQEKIDKMTIILNGVSK